MNHPILSHIKFHIHTLPSDVHTIRVWIHFLFQLSYIHMIRLLWNSDFGLYPIVEFEPFYQCLSL